MGGCSGAGREMSPGRSGFFSRSGRRGTSFQRDEGGATLEQRQFCGIVVFLTDRHHAQIHGFRCVGHEQIAMFICRSAFSSVQFGLFFCGESECLLASRLFRRLEVVSTSGLVWWWAPLVTV